MSDLDTSLKGPRRAEVRLLHPSAAKRSPGYDGDEMFIFSNRRGWWIVEASLDGDEDEIFFRNRTEQGVTLFQLLAGRLLMLVH